MANKPKSLSFISLPFEASTTFRKGTINSPDAILKELDNLDSFELLFGQSPFKGITTSIVKAHNKRLKNARKEQKIASGFVTDALNRDSFPICLGGEHTVSLGPIQAAREKGPLGVVQLDAHADLRDSYEGNPLSHACVMRRVHDLECPTLGVGIRSMSAEENQYIKDNSIDIVSAKECIESRKWHSRIDKLPERIYLTVDMDYFDPADVPGVGTPEPGGPGWYDTLRFLEHLFATKEVVGADVVELLPEKGSESSVRLAARLLGIIVGLKFSV